MTHTETCPVCSGAGHILMPKDTSTVLFTCHGCNGTGWVTVDDCDVADLRSIAWVRYNKLVAEAKICQCEDELS